MAKRKKGKKFDESPRIPLIKASLDATGKEIGDPVPMTSTVARGESMTERVKRMVRQELSQQAEAQGFETFEESQDFDIDDPWDVYHTEQTRYEILEDEFPIATGAPTDEPVGDEPPALSDPPPDKPPVEPENE